MTNNIEELLQLTKIVYYEVTEEIGKRLYKQNR